MLTVLLLFREFLSRHLMSPGTVGSAIAPGVHGGFQTPDFYIYDLKLYRLSYLAPHWPKPKVIYTDIHE